MEAKIRGSRPNSRQRYARAKYQRKKRERDGAHVPQVPSDVNLTQSGATVDWLGVEGHFWNI
jgi:hypothetical protein